MTERITAKDATVEMTAPTKEAIPANRYSFPLNLMLYHFIVFVSFFVFVFVCLFSLLKRCPYYSIRR